MIRTDGAHQVSQLFLKSRSSRPFFATVFERATESEKWSPRVFLRKAQLHLQLRLVHHVALALFAGLSSTILLSHFDTFHLLHLTNNALQRLWRPQSQEAFALAPEHRSVPTRPCPRLRPSSSSRWKPKALLSSTGAGWHRPLCTWPRQLHTYLHNEPYP